MTCLQQPSRHDSSQDQHAEIPTHQPPQHQAEDIEASSFKRAVGRQPRGGGGVGGSEERQRARVICCRQIRAWRERALGSRSTPSASASVSLVEMQSPPTKKASDWWERAAEAPLGRGTRPSSPEHRCAWHVDPRAGSRHQGERIQALEPASGRRVGAESSLIHRTRTRNRSETAGRSWDRDKEKGSRRVTRRQSIGGWATGGGRLENMILR